MKYMQKRNLGYFRYKRAASMILAAAFIFGAMVSEAFGFLPPVRPVTLFPAFQPGAGQNCVTNSPVYTFSVFDQQRNALKSRSTDTQTVCDLRVGDGMAVWYDQQTTLVHHYIFDPAEGNWESGGMTGRLQVSDYKPGSLQIVNGIITITQYRTESSETTGTPESGLTENHIFTAYSPRSRMWQPVFNSGQMHTGTLTAPVVGNGVAAFLQILPGVVPCPDSPQTSCQRYNFFAAAFDSTLPNGNWGAVASGPHLTPNPSLAATESSEFETPNGIWGYAFSPFFQNRQWTRGSAISTTPHSDFLISKSVYSSSINAYFWDLSLGPMPSWDFGDGQSAIDYSPFHVFSRSPGMIPVYTIIQTVVEGVMSSQPLLRPRLIYGKLVSNKGAGGPGAVVKLYVGNNVQNPVRQTTNDANGHYQFNDLNPNQVYRVEPPDLPPNQGWVAIGSCTPPSTGRGCSYSIGTNTIILDADFQSYRTTGE